MITLVQSWWNMMSLLSIAVILLKFTLILKQ